MIATGGDRYSLVLWLSDSAESVRARATPWLRAAADGGNAYAQFLHGAALRSGSGGAARDVGAAAEYWRRAAAQGHALSQLELGLLYWRGEEGAVPRSVVESRRLVTASRGAASSSHGEPPRKRARRAELRSTEPTRVQRQSSRQTRRCVCIGAAFGL